jgi:hypothetical protein
MCRFTSSWRSGAGGLRLPSPARLELEALYGDFDRSPLDDKSSEYVFVTRRR